MQHTSIISHDNISSHREFYINHRDQDEASEVSQEAVTKFFDFQQSGLFNWEFFCNELEYE